MNRIIYRNLNGTVTVLIPTEEALELATLEQIAIKDVPVGLPFKMIDITDLPTDRSSSRAYWLWDDTIIPDGVGGISNEF